MVNFLKLTSHRGNVVSRVIRVQKVVPRYLICNLTPPGVRSYKRGQITTVKKLKSIYRIDAHSVRNNLHLLKGPEILTLRGQRR